MTYKANVPKRFKIDSSVNNIPTAPSASAGCRAFTGLLGNQPIPYSHIQVNNESAGRLLILILPANQPVPSGDLSEVNGFYVVGETIQNLDGFNPLDTVYVISDTGSAISSGIVTLAVW